MDNEEYQKEFEKKKLVKQIENTKELLEQLNNKQKSHEDSIKDLEDKSKDAEDKLNSLT